jgi:hypothetical protein
MNCPICDKAGLAEDAKFCPQCDSNLSGFVLLKKVTTKQDVLKNTQKQVTEQLHKSQTAKKRIIVVSLLGSVLLASCGFWLYSEKTSAYNQVIKEKDSLQNVVAEKQATINKLEIQNQETSIKYVVRKGDNLIKISRIFYANGNQYREIIKDNNLQENHTLFAGDTLTIKLKH